MKILIEIYSGEKQFFPPSFSLSIALPGYAVIFFILATTVDSSMWVTIPSQISPPLYESHSTDVYVNKSSMDLCPQQTHRMHPMRERNSSIHSGLFEERLGLESQIQTR